MLRQLTAQQESAIAKLQRLRVGALFMACGTGKTQTAVALVNSIKDADLLVWICPFRTKENLSTELVECYKTGDNEYEIVDGFHRYSLMNPMSKSFSRRIYDREEGKLPIVVIDKPIQDRMASTIRHNRARGSHSIELMTNIVAELTQSGRATPGLSSTSAWMQTNFCALSSCQG